MSAFSGSCASAFALDDFISRKTLKINIVRSPFSHSFVKNECMLQMIVRKSLNN